MAIKLGSKGAGGIGMSSMPGRKFRVGAFMLVIAYLAFDFVRLGFSWAYLITFVLLTPSIALVAPELVEFWSWYARKAEEHAVDREERIYRYGYTDIRMLMGDDNRPWFAAEDVCAALGFAHADRELQRLKTGRRMRLGSGKDDYLSEAGVMDLIARSGTDETRKFRNWFTRDVMTPFNRGRDDPRPGPPAR